MVFGLGEGEMEITLGPTTFTPRETINGKVKLKLPKAVAARSLVVEFYGEADSGKKFEKVYRVSQQLGEERTYKNGESLSFSLSIPENAAAPAAQGTFGAIHDMFVPKPHSWFIEAKLDVPMAPDINARIMVYMRR